MSAAAAHVHGHGQVACASCPNTKTCDCPCNVCVLTRRRIAGHICLECGEICGYTMCDDCGCSDCGKKRCCCYEDDDHDDYDDECYDCKQRGCDGGMWCPANCRDDESTDSDMEEMMRDERAEEDRRFRAQMTRRATATAKPTSGTTFTITLTGASLTGAGLMSAVAAAAGGK